MKYGFGRFVGLDAEDAPELLARMSKRELGIDGERYGISTRLIARPAVTVADLAVAVVGKLMRRCAASNSRLGALVLSSRIVDVENAASAIADRLGFDCPAYGIERACSGFPAATELGLQLYRKLHRPVVVVAAEIISGSINWEPPDGNLADHGRARGQASKLFGDGAAAVLIRHQRDGRVHQILDAWIDEVPDEKQLIQKAEVIDSVDPWGNTRPGATGCISMPGRRGFYLVKRAPEIMADALCRSLQRASAELESGEQIAHVVPHQANGLILGRLQSQLAENEGQSPHVWQCVKNSGNTVSASIPLAMAEVQDRLPPRVVVAMPSVGAGGPGYRPSALSTGCVLIRTDDRIHET
jgi:3-oxoacyl-[acyl-carrier-protein] synthase-3